MAEAISKRISPLSPGSDLEEKPAPLAGDRARQVNHNLIFVVLVVALLFIGSSLFYVWSHHQILSLGYATSQAIRKEQTLLQENKRLRLELAALKAPSRIEKWAQQQLGLGIPQKEQLIIVR